MNLKYFLTLILTLLIALGGYAQEVDTTYIWPTNASPYLSSTFGETRSAHFHAGLDIKTWGREGYEVYATRDGILSRILITNQGYGKAIYLRHPDSTYTVYAHLQRFNDRIQAIADSIRMPDYRYEMHAFIESEQIPIHQGDIIGYTGSTGIGPPHLHYEIRNAENEPLNPLRSNLTVEDTRPPVFSALMIEPQHPSTIIDGGLTPKVYRPNSYQGLVYDFGTIPVTGLIGLSVNVYDMADKVPNKYAVYELLLLSKGDTLYHEQMNSFDFDQANNMLLNRTAPPSGRRAFQRLFLKDGNNHPFLISRKKITQGSYHQIYQVIAKDIYGNKSIAQFRFTPDTSSTAPETFSMTDSNLQSLRDGYWTEDWVIFKKTGLLNLKQEQPAVIPNAVLTRIKPSTTATLTTPDFALKTRFEAGSFFDTLSVLQFYQLERDTLKISLAGKNLPVKKEFQIQFYTGSFTQNSDKLNLYRIEDDGELSYVDSWISGKTLFGYPSQLGNFAVLRDTIPPVIQAPVILNKTRNDEVIRIKTDDNLSGIDFKSAVFILNGVRGIAEYDYETDEFTYYRPGTQLNVDNTIIFRVKDRAGNMAESVFRLSAPVD